MPLRLCWYSPCCCPPTGGPIGDISELQAGAKLLRVVEGWLRQEKAARRAAQVAPPPKEAPPRAAHPFMPSKHLAFYR